MHNQDEPNLPVLRLKVYSELQASVIEETLECSKSVGISYSRIDENDFDSTFIVLGPEVKLECISNAVREWSDQNTHSTRIYIADRCFNKQLKRAVKEFFRGERMGEYRFRRVFTLHTTIANHKEFEDFLEKVGVTFLVKE